MKLFCLAYCSTATKPLNLAEVRRLASNASQKNTAINITGCLVYSNNQFFQILEGSQENINSLYLKISKDPAHTNLKILCYNQIEIRMFRNWGMGLIETNKTKEILKVHFEKKFSPEELSPSQTIHFAKDIQKLFCP